jgi:hypothetical protein
MSYMTTTSDRFWAKVDKSGECWTWKAGHATAGYGMFTIDGKTIGAHRVSYYLTHGEWPNVARHTCDNKGCVNPDHILDGTQFDNIQDAVERNLFAKQYKTHCKWGHEMSPDNVRITKYGTRRCAACRLRWSREYRARKKERS